VARATSLVGGIERRFLIACDESLSEEGFSAGRWLSFAAVVGGFAVGSCSSIMPVTLVPRGPDIWEGLDSSWLLDSCLLDSCLLDSWLLELSLLDASTCSSSPGDSATAFLIALSVAPA
jgi:hypothetical protein